LYLFKSVTGSCITLILQTRIFGLFSRQGSHINYKENGAEEGWCVVPKSKLYEAEQSHVLPTARLEYEYAGLPCVE